MDRVKAGKLQGPVEKFTVWETFQNPASDLISPKIEINLGEEADKAARDFETSIVSAYRLSTNEVILLGLNNNLLGLDRLLKH
jgi:hypothetical protein